MVVFDVVTDFCQYFTIVHYLLRTRGGVWKYIFPVNVSSYHLPNLL